jgi:hypothetical protein
MNFNTINQYTIINPSNLTSQNQLAEIKQNLNKISDITKDFFENRLPDETLLHIFTCLDSKNIVKLGLTNQRLYQRCLIESSIWQFLLKRDYSFVSDCRMNQNFKLYKIYTKYATVQRNVETSCYQSQTLTDPVSVLNGNLHAHEKAVSCLHVDRAYIYSAAAGSFKIWSRKDKSLVARYEYSDAFMSKIISHENRLYVLYSNFGSNIQYINIHDLKQKNCPRIKTCSTGQDFQQFIFKTHQNQFYTYSENQVKIWDLEGNFLSTKTTYDFELPVSENLKIKNSDHYFFSYSVSKLPLKDWTGGSILQIQDAKTKKTIKKIDPTNVYSIWSSYRTNIGCFCLFKGSIYIGLSDGQIKIYNFNLSSPNLFSYLDSFISRLNSLNSAWLKKPPHPG